MGSGGIGALSGIGGLVGTEVPGVLGIGISAPVVLGWRLDDRGTVVPRGGDGPARLSVVGGLDVGRPCRLLTYCLTVVGSSGRPYHWALGGSAGAIISIGAVMGGERPGDGSG